MSAAEIILFLARSRAALSQSLTFAFVFAVVLSGYARGPTTPKANLPAPSAADLSAPRMLRLEQLGYGFSIRAAANSWPDLVQKLKPAFVWNGRDMIWIETSRDGRPRFVLDEAWFYKPPDQPGQWVLVSDGVTAEDYVEHGPEEGWWGQYRYPSKVVPLLDAIPSTGHIENYAVIKDRRRGAGAVYEIGWAGEEGRGRTIPNPGG